MRTRLAHIEPGCPYCNADHNPDIRCRCQPDSVRGVLTGPQPPVIRERHCITDAAGKLIAVKQIYREE